MADRARKTRPKPVDAAPLRDRVPTLTPAHAEALRLFFAHPRHWLLRDGGVLRFDAGRGHGEAFADARGNTFALDADGMHLALRFDAGAEADHPGDGLRWNDHVGRSRVLAWSLAHETRLMRLSDALGVSLLPLVDDAGDADAGGVWLDFTIDDYADDESQTPIAQTRGALRVPADWLVTLAQRAETPFAEDPAPPLGHWRALPATVSLVFAIPALAGRDWRNLRPGDAIVVGRSARPPTLQAQAGGRAWPLSSTSSGWRVEAAAQPLPAMPKPPMENTKMSDNDESATATAAAVVEDPARSLPVRVEFEIGQVELSLGELADVQPGYVFALPAQLEGANVVIRANGRASGRGEVVAVGDTLGVRLLSWI